MIDRLVLVFLGLAVALGAIVFLERRVSRGAKAEPRIVTVADLATNGPADNGHVVLTDFSFSSEFVYEEEDGRWKTLWIPVVARGTLNADGKAATFGVVIKTSRAPDQAALQRYQAETREVQGLIVNAVTPLAGEEKKLLAESYPAIDLSRVWVVQEGRKPTGRKTFMALSAGAAVSAIIGVALALVRFRRRREAEGDASV